MECHGGLPLPPSFSPFPLSPPAQVLASGATAGVWNITSAFVQGLPAAGQNKTNWAAVTWNAVVPTGTTLTMQARAAEQENSFCSLFTTYVPSTACGGSYCCPTKFPPFPISNGTLVGSRAQYFQVGTKSVRIAPHNIAPHNPALCPRSLHALTVLSRPIRGDALSWVLLLIGGAFGLRVCGCLTGLFPLLTGLFPLLTGLFPLLTGLFLLLTGLFLLPSTVCLPLGRCEPTWPPTPLSPPCSCWTCRCTTTKTPSARTWWRACYPGHPPPPPTPHPFRVPECTCCVRGRLGGHPAALLPSCPSSCLRVVPPPHVCRYVPVDDAHVLVTTPNFASLTPAGESRSDIVAGRTFGNYLWGDVATGTVPFGMQPNGLNLYVFGVSVVVLRLRRAVGDHRCGCVCASYRAHRTPPPPLCWSPPDFRWPSTTRWTHPPCPPPFPAP